MIPTRNVAKFQTFTSYAVCQVTGLKYSCLDYWMRTGVLKPSIYEGKGTGQTRVFSLSDAVIIRILSLLRNNGFSLRKLKKASCFLKSTPDLLTGALYFAFVKGDFAKIVPEDLPDLLSGNVLVLIISTKLVVTEIANRMEKFKDESEANHER